MRSNSKLGCIVPHMKAKEVPGQKNTFAPTAPSVPGQSSGCPCGFGAYDSSDNKPLFRISLSAFFTCGIPSFLDTIRDVNETLKPETSSRFLAFSLRRDRDLPRTPRDKTFDFRSKTEIETYTDRDAFRDHRLKVAHSIVVTIFHLLCNVHASVTCTISV